MDRALQQPDFSLVASHLRGAAEHFERCVNLPAVDGGSRILERLDAMTERQDAMMQQMIAMTQQITILQETTQRGFTDMGERITDMGERITDMGERIDALDRRVTVTNKNVIARMRNGGVTHRGVPLNRLYNEQDGRLIEGCPATLEAFDSLPARDVVALLEQLGEEVPRGALQRKELLESSLGIMHRATGRS